MDELKKRLRIAILGTRGIPANYGGFETFVEELSKRFVKNGHLVTVYARRASVEGNSFFYEGIRIIVLPTIKHKYLDTVAHTFLSVFHAIFTKTDVMFFCNSINSIFMVMPRIFGKKCVINVGGLEWKRKKWGFVGRLAYKISELFSIQFSNAIVTDSKVLKSYYKERFNITTNYISYGADNIVKFSNNEILNRFGLTGKRFILYVSRLEPENNAHIVIKAYERVKTELPLVVAGDAPYAKKYISQLHNTKDKRIKFVGRISKDECHSLLSNSYLYIHGNEVGGTNPALLQAMACGNCVLVNGVNFNLEVIGDAGLWFEQSNSIDLKNKIEFLLGSPEVTDRYRLLAKERVKKYYSWDDVANSYEKLFYNFL